MILRCMQSSGSSGTVALGSAVMADLSTRAERGKYIGYASIGISLGPTLGPVIGGLLDHYLGWRSIFWFLVILSSVCFVVILIVFPETCRAVVGNGSVPPASWNRPLWAFWVRHSRFRDEQGAADYTTIQKLKRRPNPISALLLATQKETGLVLIYGALLYAGYMAVISTLSTQLTSLFGFNSIQVGLCYLPMGMGSISSRWIVGRLLDWNFRREARLQGMIIQKNRQQEIENFNIERARLAITIPLIYLSSICIIAYGWVMQYRTALAGPLVMLFFTGVTTTSAFNTLNTLVVDIHYQSAATAAAASNLFRCLLGAGATAVASPLIGAIGIGWTATCIAGLWVVGSPALWIIFHRGYRWRQELANKEQQKLDKSTP
jgi:MFS family permease